jgi:hypothetical protein
LIGRPPISRDPPVTVTSGSVSQLRPSGTNRDPPASNFAARPDDGVNTRYRLARRSGRIVEQHLARRIEVSADRDALVARQRIHVARAESMLDCWP